VVRWPVVGVRSPTSPAGIAGLQTFDMVTMYAGAPIRRQVDLERALQASRGATVPVGYLRPRRVEGALGGLFDLEVFDPGLAQLTPEPGTGEVLRRTGIESPDLYVADVDPDSPEYQMGLRRGARILAHDGVAPSSWERFHERVMGAGRELRELRFVQGGREEQGSFSLRPTSWTDEFGQRYVRLSFDTRHWVPVEADAPIENPSPTLYAMRAAIRETSEAMRFLSTGIVRVIQGRVSIRTVGGPIMIYDVSRSSAAEGPWGFLWLMALVSINLGLINLLPIPTLDGGHLLFFAIEGATRRPVPLWVRQTASVMGLLVLAGVMFVAFKNDIERKLGDRPPPVAGVLVRG
jgi:regulator of sigma E protease